MTDEQTNRQIRGKSTKAEQIEPEQRKVHVPKCYSEVLDAKNDTSDDLRTIRYPAN